MEYKDATTATVTFIIVEESQGETLETTVTSVEFAAMLNTEISNAGIVTITITEISAVTKTVIAGKIIILHVSLSN